MVSLKEKSLVPVASCLQLASSSPFPHTRMDEAPFSEPQEVFFQVGNPRTRREGGKSKAWIERRAMAKTLPAVLPLYEKKWKIEAQLNVK